MIFLTTRYGFLVRILHWCTHQSMDNALETMELTAAQGHIMAYLAHSRKAPCPRDLEAEFSALKASMNKAASVDYIVSRGEYLNANINTVGHFGDVDLVFDILEY